MLALLAAAILGGVALGVRYSRKPKSASRAVRDPVAADANPVFVEENNPDPVREAKLPTSRGDTTSSSSSAAAINSQAPLDGPPSGVTWTSAAHEPGITRGGIRVRVLRAEFGEVLARDARNNPITAGPGDFLKVYIQIENRTDSPVRYVSWFGNQFAAEGKQVAARLWDDTGKLYPQQRFDQHRGIQGHMPETTFAKAEFVRDVVIFAAPKSTVANPQRTFRLELPGGAVGVRDFYRFEFKVD